MISQLQGILVSKSLPHVVIDVAGVGYEVELSLGAFYALPQCGDKVLVLTQMIVREDAQWLIGFRSADERQLFKELIRVSGVGPKLALAILSSIEPDEFKQCIIQQDCDQLTQLPGVGKKTAQRLLMELHDRLAKETKTTVSSATLPQTALQEAQAALESLGYKPQQALAAIKAVHQPDSSSQTLIRKALQTLATPS